MTVTAMEKYRDTIYEEGIREGERRMMKDVTTDEA